MKRFAITHIYLHASPRALAVIFVLAALILAVVFYALAKKPPEQKHFMVEQPSQRGSTEAPPPGSDSPNQVVRTFTITIPTSSFPAKKE
jgi:hypothetical protein